jgi:hypothetical protein
MRWALHHTSSSFLQNLLSKEKLRLKKVWQFLLLTSLEKNKIYAVNHFGDTDTSPP